ncbi:hypothetical protein TSTA_046940 [Talaromyces stipitatus ATCC 10500]|uniref:Nephrocystin 3-like N-terminal domain-containing protein n=1 Tax=Talaromyces stipitatus (strain ATCC 10500 / CBS 375.48 / QM 6759 / NRRL 1006) TaxID=441959 RepID=B8MK87_TALSN|nr:uncharacterized protein TSTA_046940 [Talaromyces stipitatus ATCC 10500]EED15242.1 hypothetical protein TSTA_046940 [Talaromyces stipitatus ATCC 10500]
MPYGRYLRTFNLDILNWISTVVPRQEHIRLLEDGKLERKYANAGQWLFHDPEFESWSAHENKDTATLWLCGPGISRKGVLVIEHSLKYKQSIDADKEQIAYFYCTKKQGEVHGSDPKTILRSLVRQLAWSADNQSISKPVKDIYDESQLSHECEESRLPVTACVSLPTKLVSTR